MRVNHATVDVWEKTAVSEGKNQRTSKPQSCMEHISAADKYVKQKPKQRSELQLPSKAPVLALHAICPNNSQ
jgi:hypothetical protein